MDALACHATGDSSTTIDRPRRRSSTRTLTPSGSVQHGPVVWPDGNPKSTGPGKSARQPRDRRRARSTSPPGSSQPRISPNTSARARASTPLEPQLRQHAVDPVRPLVDVLEEQHAAVRRIERVRRPERRGQLRHRAAEQRTLPPRPARSTASPSGASSRPAPSLRQRQERALVVARRRRAPAAARASGRAAR